jgi:Protein of unknown function (DUF1566)
LRLLKAFAQFTKRRWSAILWILPLALIACASAQPRPVAADRFQATAYGSIIDRQTGLEWFVGPDQKTFVAEARSFVDELRAGEMNDWRLPTFHELRTIWSPETGSKNLPPLLATTGDMVWSGELAIFGYVYIRLANGTIGFDTLGRRKHGYRAFAVRGRPHSGPYLP